jgi:predicted metal-dependent hydrolase
MPAGTYDNPLADFLDALPQYINQYQQNQLAQKRYQDEIDYRNERARVADERYNEEQKRLQQEKEYNKNRQIKLDQANVLKEQNDQKFRDLNLTLSALNPEQALQYLIKDRDADGVDSSDLRLIQKETEEFNRSLSPIINIAPAGNIKTINKSLLDINTFMEKNQDNPLFQANSSAYGKVIDKRNKLITRLNQVSSDGYVDPKYWTQVDPTKGRVAKELYDKSLEKLNALSDQKSITNDLSDQKDLDDKIEKELANQEKIRSAFKLASIPEIKKEETESMALSKLDALLKMNPAGAQSIASAVSSVPSDIIPDQPAITDSEMDDVSNQIAMNQKQVEDNLAIINEDVPVVVDAQQPIQSPEIINEIQDTNELQDLPQDTGSNFILDRLLPERARAEESVDRDESSLPPLDMGLEEDMTTDEPVVEEGIKPVSEFKSSRDRNPSSIANALGSKKTSPVRKLFNLLSDYEKAEVSTLQGASKKRELKRINTSIQQLSKQISDKIGDFIDPQTGDFSDSDYTDRFYTQLSRNTGVSVSKLKDTLKRLAS